MCDAISDAVVLSTQHDPDITQGQIQLDIKKYVFDEILPGGMVDENTKFYINPTGRFVIGGPFCIICGPLCGKKHCSVRVG